MTIEEAVRKGRREGLEAMRDALAKAMDDAEPSVVAQINAQLRANLKELDELTIPEVSASDDLADQRARRRATAAVVPSAPEPAVKRGRRGGGTR